MVQISTNSLYTNVFNDISTATERLNNEMRQVSDATAVETFLDLSKNGQIENALNIDYKLNLIQKFKANNDRVSSRINSMTISIEAIIEATSKIKDSVVKRLSAVGDNMNFTQIARSSLSSIMDNLNSQFEGRYLFAGSKTTTQPVSDIVNHSNLLNSKPTANYYNGDEVSISASISESLTVNYGVTAKNQAFQDLIGAVNTAIEGDTYKDNAKLTEALEILNNSVVRLNEMRTVLGNHQSAIKNIDDANSSLTQNLEIAYSKITDTDVPKVVLQMSKDKMILEASYSAFSKIARLSLSEYLR